MTLRISLVKIAATLTLLTALLPLSIKAEDELPVVATFSILGDMVQRIGGSAVEVTTLVGRNGDTHVYQPTPADAKAVKQAAILFTNGLEFEGWLDRLAEAAEFNGQLIVTTDGIDTIAFDEHGDDEHHDDEHHDDEHHDDEHHDDEHHDDEHHDDEHHDVITGSLTRTRGKASKMRLSTLITLLQRWRRQLLKTQQLFTKTEQLTWQSLSHSTLKLKP